MKLKQDRGAKNGTRSLIKKVGHKMKQAEKRKLE